MTKAATQIIRDQAKRLSAARFKIAALEQCLEDLMDECGAGSVPAHWCPNKLKCQTCKIWKRAKSLTETTRQEGQKDG